MAIQDYMVHLENGKMAVDTPAAAVRAMAARAAASPAIVIHFHGGLVAEKSGRETAARLEPVYSQAGAYPVFFVWESGLLETLHNNLGEIASERLFQLLWKRLVRVVLRKVTQNAGDRAAGILPVVDSTANDQAIERSLARSPAGGDAVGELASSEPAVQGVSELSAAERSALEQELQVDAELTMEVQAVSNGLRDPAQVREDLARSAVGVRASTTTLMDPAAIEQIIDRPDPTARGALSLVKVAKSFVTVAVKVIARFVRKRDHGLHATVIEEILRAYYVASVGKVVWDLMKKDTGDCFQPDADVFGGTCLIEAIAAAASAGTALPRIVLVGHSTGAIYISEFIEKASTVLPAADFGVVFLAPASRFEKTAATIRRHGARIRSVRSFGMADQVEKEDRLVPVLYPHSLLYFVSGVVEGGDDVPLVGMQRFYDSAKFPASEFPDVEVVRAFLAADATRQVWSVVQGAGTGLNSASRRHGDFDNDPITLKSLGELIRSGF